MRQFLLILLTLALLSVSLSSGAEKSPEKVRFRGLRQDETRLRNRGRTSTIRKILKLPHSHVRLKFPFPFRSFHRPGADYGDDGLERRWRDDLAPRTPLPHGHGRAGDVL